MGRGGGGGGGRSSSSGGSRSSGGRIGGGSSHRGGYKSSSGSNYRSSSSSNSWYRPSRPAMLPRYPGRYTYGRRHTTIVHHSSPLSILASFILILIIFSVWFISTRVGGDSSITPSTIERTKLASGSVNETEYYTDELDWISSSSKLEAGMKYFYKETGVQPYLYITDSIDGEKTANQSNMDAYVNKLYDKLFTDEAHVLILFHEYNSSGKYSTWYVAGKQAKTVVDKEGADILLDYIDKYYYSDYTEDELFSKAFREAADRMMTVTKSPWPSVITVVVVLIILVVAFCWWRAIQKRKKEEADETERILSMDIGDLSDSDPDLQDLENRYK